MPATRDAAVTTVRGLDRDLYAELVAYARRHGYVASDLLNASMRRILREADGAPTAQEIAYAAGFSAGRGTKG